MQVNLMRKLAVALIASAVLVSSASAVDWTVFEGTARGFPVLRDPSGKKLADGDFAQWIDGSQLHVRIRWEFGGGRSAEETAVFRQAPQLIQDQYSLRELREGKLVRRFEVDFTSATATAEKQGEKGLERWSEKVDVEPGRTFSGFGFAMAIKGLRSRLVAGEQVELKAVGFTPKPRVVSVAISHGGVDRIRMAQRNLTADRFILHAKVPWIAQFFIDVPDTRIWLTSPPPAGFLRWEGPFAEPGDPVVRVDLLPGTESGPAEPTKANSIE